MTDAPARLAMALADRYRLDRELGQGGMATVYLAHDLRHERQVAIKVLHPELSAVLGAERFLSEIKTTANLQHPHILPLFDSGAADGLLYYVMPFVEGETLRGRLSREKQLPIEEAVAIARGAAAALEHAHRRGVIHRDIKPENILLQDGQALVADFGIALAVKAAGGVRLTQTGLSLGTPQYMSPEQATAERELDARSDVYALAAVTYEMLAGEPPFTGSTTQAIIAKLMTEEPRAPSVLRRAVPAHVEAAVMRGLEKLPADRWASAKEFADALARDAETRTDARTRGRGDAKHFRVVASSRLRVALVTAAALLLAALGLLAGRWSARRSGDESSSALPSRLALFPTTETIVSSGLARIIDISQDGQVVAYAANGAASDYVAIRRLDGAASAALPTTDNVRQIRFSPDGRFLYSPRGAPYMQRIPIAGGSWTPVRAMEATPHLDFEADGTIWWSPTLVTGLHRIRAGTDKDEQPFAADSTQAGTQLQQILPDGKFALVLISAGLSNTGQAAMMDLKTGKVSPIFDFPVVEIRYTGGVLVYALPDNTLNAVVFDPATGKATGEPNQIATNISLTGAGVAQFAVSRNGTLIYLPTFGRELMEVDRTGIARPLTEARQNYHSPRYSPDGKRIAVDNVGQDGRDVWVLDREQRQLSRITFDRDGHDPVWTRDGRSIYYTSGRSGTFGIYRVRPGVANPPDSVLANSALSYVGIPVGDGPTLITTGTDLNGHSNTDIALVRPGAEHPVEPLFATPYSEGWAAPSPDGKWVAYTSDQTGRQEVYVRPLSKEGTLIQVSLEGGSEPVWSRNGHELFYRQPKGGRVEIVAAALRLGQEAEVVARQTLFDASDYEPAQPHANYDVSPDGRHFVMLRRSPSSHIVVIQNLRALVERGQQR